MFTRIFSTATFFSSGIDSGVEHVTLLPLLVKETSTFFHFRFFPVTISLQLLVTAVFHITKSLPVTKKITIYVAQPLLRYVYRFKKMKVESAKKWYLYTSNKIVTISKEMHKTHVEKA